MKKEIENALAILARKLKGIKWVLVGSANLAVQGINVTAHDIDVLVHERDVGMIDNVLSDFIVEKMKYDEKIPFKGWIGKYKIEGVEIEIMCDLKFLFRGKWEDNLKNRLENVKYVKIAGVDIPVGSLEEQLKGYKKLNREKDKEKIKKIEEKLSEY